MLVRAELYYKIQRIKTRSFNKRNFLDSLLYFMADICILETKTLDKKIILASLIQFAKRQDVSSHHTSDVMWLGGGPLVRYAKPTSTLTLVMSTKTLSEFFNLRSVVSDVAYEIFIFCFLITQLLNV